MVANEVAKNWILLNNEITILENAYEIVDFSNSYKLLFELKDSVYYSFYEDKILHDFCSFKSKKNIKKSIGKKLRILYRLIDRVQNFKINGYYFDFRLTIQLFVSKILFFNNDDDEYTNLFSVKMLSNTAKSVINKLANNETNYIRHFKSSSF